MTPVNLLYSEKIISLVITRDTIILTHHSNSRNVTDVTNTIINNDGSVLVS